MLSSPSSLAGAQPDPWLLAADLLDPPQDNDRALAERCRDHLPTFIREAWPIVEPATPFVLSWHIDCLAEHLDAVTRGQLLRLIVNIPPRTMKSLTTAVFWPCWEWLRAAHVRWLYATYAADLSTRDSVKCRRLIESRGGRQDGTLFQRLGYQGVLRLLTDKPWALTGDQNAKTRYDTTEMGFRLATSVGGVATGEGGDRIVVDDPVNPKQARSDAERETANTWWDETMTTRFNNGQASAVIVMQRLHEQDLTGHLLEQGGWHHLCLPAEYAAEHPYVYPASVILPQQTYNVQGEDGEVEPVIVPGGRALPGDPRTVDGELLEPVRLSLERLVELLRGLGGYGYAGQMQQLPAPAEGGMFKRHWWRRWASLPPQWEKLVASWDMRFSDSQEAASSYVVGQIWGVDGADRYLLAQIRARLSFTETLKAVEALHAWMPEARSKLIERKANGAAVIDTLRKKVPGLIPIEPEGGKEVRAAAVEPYVEAGNIYLPAAEFIPCPAGYELEGEWVPFEPTSVTEFLDEMSVFPNGAHDDQVDAFTQVINWLENRRGGAKTQSRLPSHTAPVVVRGGLTLVGEQFIDKT